MAIQTSCDTAVSGCVFMMRTEEDDKDRLLRITQEHVREQHGKDFSLDEIEEQHMESVEL
jgi:predicted small metal-binding protein